MRKSKVWIIFGFVVFVLIMVLVKTGSGQLGNRDLVVGIIGNQGVKIENLSFGRRMVDEVAIGPAGMVWIPYGPGWYRSDTVGKFLSQENKKEVAKKVFFYNFGTMPDVVVWGGDYWLDQPDVIMKMGWINWINVKFFGGRLIWRDQVIENQLGDPKWDQIIARDVAESTMGEEDVRLSIFNLSKESGMAAWMGQVLGRGGLFVNSISNSTEQVSKCKIVFGKGSELKRVGVYLADVLGECVHVVDSGLSENEIELYFGDGFAQMVNYGSYKNN
jgi:hypothetical protein